MVNFVAATGNRQIGLLSGSDGWFYPLPALMQKHYKNAPIRFDYINDFPWPTYNVVHVPRVERSAKNILVIIKAWDWNYRHPAPKTLLEKNGSQFWLARDFGPFAVFTRKQQPLENNVFFEQGWYGIEHVDWGWAVWTSGTGTLTLVRPADGDVLLEGEMLSATVPNQVSFRINGAVVASTKIDWQYNRHFGPVRLPLKAGDNRIEVVSQQPATHLPKDPRDLAVLLANLVITDEHDHKPIKLKPVSDGQP
jgi:hypothetical protein